MGLQSISESEYNTWLAEISNKIRQSRLTLAREVNKALLTLYWELGKAIAEKQQEANWGDKIIAQLSKDLKTEFPEIKGFSRSNLFYIRKWFLFYNKVSIVQQGVGLLPEILAGIPWAHHIHIFTRCDNTEEAIFFINATITNGWSRNILLQKLNAHLYKRQGKALNNFNNTLPQPQSDLARETLKNPYIFDFLDLGEDAHEREIEKSLIKHIKKFILELGRGFAYVGNQFNLNVDGNDYFLDLLFYNYNLNCFVIFELKVGEFKPEYTGKLNFYINSVNEKIKGETHKATIGILLCKTPNETIIKYSLEGIKTPIGVADYELTQSLPKHLKIEMPSVDELEQELEKEFEKLQHPLEQKVERFKSLIAQLNKPEVKVTKNKKTVSDIYDKNILPLIKEIKEKLSEVINCFHDSEIILLYNNIFSKHQKIDEVLDTENIWQLGIELILKGFKNAGTQTFTLNQRLEVIFDTYKFSIGTDHHNVWEERLYDQLYTTIELSELGNRFSEIVLDAINQKIESLIR